MQHVLSLSYGKDSLACLGAIEQLRLPLDRIVHAELLATDTIPADPPPMVKFKRKADSIIKARWGIEVEHIPSPKTYEQQFYTKYKNGKRVGRIYGWPLRCGPWCNSRLKVSTLSKAQRGAGSIYIGIAADEPERIIRLASNKTSPLAAAGWTERMCREWCEKHELLSPIYTTANRGGCWFCHNQGVDQLRLLRRDYPDYWALMLKWDTDSPRTFKADGRTVHDYEKRFQLEDEGFLKPGDKRFKWSMLEDELNMRYF